MAATLGNGNITFGDGSVMSSATLAWSQVSSKPFNDLQGNGNWNCTAALGAPANTGGNANCTNCQYSLGTVLTRSGDSFSASMNNNYAGYNNCNCNCACACNC